MEGCLFCRLFYLDLAWFIASWLLYYIIGAKRMGGSGTSRKWLVYYWVMVFTGMLLTWFIPFSINTMFWAGIGIIILALVIFNLAYFAMREHPEKKKVVVDWGIYGVFRHPMVMGSNLGILGIIVAGWNPSSTLYIVLCIYFIVYVLFNRFAMRNEEKRNVEKFGQEYVDYMKKVPRFFSRQRR